MSPKGLHGSAGNLSRASTEKESLPVVNIFPAMEIHPVIHTENYLWLKGISKGSQKQSSIPFNRQYGQE
jgi:hypothetical protein